MELNFAAFPLRSLIEKILLTSNKSILNFVVGGRARHSVRAVWSVTIPDFLAQNGEQD
jgi:hypothetical protein